MGGPVGENQAGGNLKKKKMLRIETEHFFLVLIGPFMQAKRALHLYCIFEDFASQNKRSVAIGATDRIAMQFEADVLDDIILD